MIEKKYKNVGFLFILLIPFAVFGFYKSYLIQFPNFEKRNDIYIHFHAIISFIWILLLVIQPLLIRFKKMELHRKLGKISYVLFPLLILSLIPLLVKEYSRGSSMLMSGINLVILCLFYTLAMIHKRNAYKHMRYMIAIALVFVTPTLGRVVIFWFGGSFSTMINIVYSAINLILFLLLLSDKFKQKDIIPYTVSFISFLTYQIALYIF